MNRRAVILLCTLAAFVPGAAFSQEDLSFSTDVWPIFEARCIECHGSEKQNGGVRFDDLDWASEIDLLSPGKPEESLIFTLITLPTGHDDIMPNEGEPLTRAQTDAIGKWIMQGGKFGDFTPPEGGTPRAVQLVETLKEGLDPASETALASIRELGALAMPLAMDNPLIRVDFQLVGDAISDAEIAKVTEVADHVTWLNLAKTNVTDEGLAPIAKLPRLTSLHLEKTGITDAGLAKLEGLENLEYLNLYGTQVTDEGIQKLATLPNLKKLYLWQTNVTKEGADKLMAALPGVDINLGLDLSAPAEETEQTAEADAESKPLALALFFTKDSCCAKAAADGGACEHPCCVEATAKNEVCTKCNSDAAQKQAVAKLFTADSCCSQALAKGELCSHPCCQEAWAKLEVCTKCNVPAAAPAPAAAKPDLAALFDADSCCAKAAAADGACEHPCCVEAAAKNEVCTKCNPGAVAKLFGAAEKKTSKLETEAPKPEPIALARAAPEKLSFNKHIRPILSQNCYQCHGPDSAAREADLRLDLREGAIASAIVPGDSAASPLVEKLTHANAAKRMPPPESERRPNADDIALLKQWIDEGAEYEPHWAYITAKRPALPPVADTKWPANAVDHFVSAMHIEQGLTPSPEADPATLVRRLSLDLTGLPPNPEDVAAYAANPTDETYTRLVEKYLASPHYGERMAMYWLDLVRYADTNGYHSDEPRSVFPYRDYVINAFNENKPFDQFTIEQLAGDLLPDATLEQKIASGYNRMNQITAEGGAQPKEYRAIYNADRVRTTASVWLGATMGCAQCHDHKFDPYSIKDFYSFAAFFADIEEKEVYGSGGTWEPYLELPTEAQTAERESLHASVAKLNEKIATPTEDLYWAQWNWEEETRGALAGIDRGNGWSPMQPQRPRSNGGATLDVLEDYSVLASGKLSDTDVYTVQLKTDAQNITAIRLESLTHKRLNDSLARQGGTVVVTGLSVQAAGKNVPIQSAHTDRFVPPYTIDNLTDDKDGGAWVFHTGNENDRVQAIFVFAEPIPGGPDTTLNVRISLGSSIAPKTLIGRFRLAITTAAAPSLDAPDELPENVFAALRVFPEMRTPEEAKSLHDYYRGVSPVLDEYRQEIAVAEARLNELKSEVTTTLVTVALDKPRETRVLPRGNWLDESGPLVDPAVPEFLGALDNEGRPTRLDLAEWIVDPENPLSSRTFVNRLWKLYFGAGIAPVLDDLGAQGQWPSNPDLLDWLSAEFVDSGWDVKRMVKTIVTSRAYRQSSVAEPALRETDPYNRYFARQTRYRLPAELVRDNALAVSGLLNEDIGGRSVYPYQPDGYYDNCNQFGAGPALYPTEGDEQQYRRGMYTFWKRSFLHPSMMAFDAPTREECVAERPRSNTPQQALVLLNDPTYVEAAKVFAERILREGGNDTESRLDFAFEQAVCREPSAEEREVLERLLDKHRNEFAKNTGEPVQLLNVGLSESPEQLDETELAAWTSIARTILNLHEVVTRS